MFSAFNPSKCTHTWSSGQPTLRRPGSSWGFSALLKGVTSVVDNSCRSRDLNPQPRITNPALYPLGHDCPCPCSIHLDLGYTHTSGSDPCLSAIDPQSPVHFTSVTALFRVKCGSFNHALLKRWLVVCIHMQCER